MFKYFKEVCAEHGDFSVIKFLAFHIGNSYARSHKTGRNEYSFGGRAAFALSLDLEALFLLLMSTFQLYKDVVCPLNLPAVCNSFASVRFYEGIVDLCLTAAQKLDPSNLALHFYKSGEPAEDTDGMQYYLKRSLKHLYL